MRPLDILTHHWSTHSSAFPILATEIESSKGMCTQARKDQSAAIRDGLCIEQFLSELDGIHVYAGLHMPVYKVSS